MISIDFLNLFFCNFTVNFTLFNLNHFLILECFFHLIYCIYFLHFTVKKTFLFIKTFKISACFTCCSNLHYDNYEVYLLYLGMFFLMRIKKPNRRQIGKVNKVMCSIKNIKIRSFIRHLLKTS